MIDLTELGVEKKLSAEAFRRYHTDPVFHAKVHRVRNTLWLLNPTLDGDAVIEAAALTLVLEDLDPQ